MCPVPAGSENAADPAAAGLQHQHATPPSDGGGSTAAVAEPRVCDACGSQMQAAQDWCLECGTAAPGRLGARPGLRAIATVAAATLALAGGAVGASYAALSEDAKLEAGQAAPAGGGPVAQVVPDLPPASAPPAPTGAAGAVTGAAGLPKVTAPSVKLPTPSATVAPATPVTPVTPVTPTDSGGGDTGGSGTDTSTDTDTTTPEEDDTADTTRSLTALELGADAVSIYDPYQRVVAKGDPVDAYDGDRDTTFRIATADADKPMGVGLVVDLEKTTKVRAVELLTDTPGYRVELYGTTGSDIPKDVIDTRWDHYADRSRVDEGTKDGNVAGDDKDRISLGGVRDARYLLLWITTPPEKGPTVRVAELNLFK